jgi:hypothetical protein
MKYYVEFKGGIWIDAKSPNHAYEIFNSELGGDDLLDSIDEQKVLDENGDLLIVYPE